MLLTQWAQKWSIPEPALVELRRQFGLIPMAPCPDIAGKSEAAISNLVKLEATQKGCRLWRNNIGAFHTPTGYVRYGLCNESAAINKQIKSADLIGIRSVLITQDMVGHVIGQFLSREIKTPGWTYTGTEREQAQLAWMKLIISMGGNACFANRQGTI